MYEVKGWDSEYRTFLTNVCMYIPRRHGVTFKMTASITVVREDFGVINTDTSESTQVLLTRDDE